MSQFAGLVPDTLFGSQPIEEKSSATATPTLTYITGRRVMAQANSSCVVSFFLTDGHGSTRLMVNASGSDATLFNYDAFGMAINFNAAIAATTVLFGGDGFYDQPTGTYFHSSGRLTLNGMFFQRDSEGNGTDENPISLNTYLYGDGNPIDNNDPTGRFSLVDILSDMAIGSIITYALSPIIKPAISFLAKLLIPAWVSQEILDAGLYDAITLGGNISANVGLGSLPIGFTAGGGLEALWSPKTYGAALYGYAIPIGLDVGKTNWSVGVTGAVGAVWGTPNSYSYTKHFVTLSVPFSALQQALREKITADVVEPVMSTITSVVAAASGDLTIYHAAASTLETVGQTAVTDLSDLSKLIVNIFFDPTGGGSFGVSLGVGYTIRGNATNNVAASYSYYWQLLPWNKDVPFR